MGQTRYGAYPEDWEVLARRYGALTDLLPVVSNPTASVHTSSAIKSIGKTPSRYTGTHDARKVVGFVGWTQHRATDEEIAHWSKEPDYGICLQTRDIRAIDIDVDDDTQAGNIERECLRILGGACPVRVREGSGKRLILFRLSGKLRKRKMKVDGGIVEFLADGQQCVVAGTHTSGARYVIRGGWPEKIPEVSEEVLNAAWDKLFSIFSTESEQKTSSAYTERRPAGSGHMIKPDDVLDALNVLGWGAEGQAFIACPFEAEHTCDSGITATCYFPKGSRGYERGHFKCLHAHCEDRTDGDFINALGIFAEQFPDIQVEETDTHLTPARLDPLPNGLTRNKKGVEPTQRNILAVLRAPQATGFILRFDEFRSEIMYAPSWEPTSLRPWKDTDYVKLRERLEECGFPTLNREILRDSVAYIAQENTFDSAIEWLNSLKWDGVPRVSNFFSRYFNVADGEYARAVSLYLWTALAGRVLQPGIQADMVPVLVGAQGLGKTIGISSLAVAPELFETVDLMARDADLARRMRGKLVIEIGELRGLNSRDLESVKEFITRKHESWVPKFKEFSEAYPRRCVFIGSTNQVDFLSDTTGNRRWLPLNVGKVNVSQIVKDREQLWAEARELFILFGVEWREAKHLAEFVHEDYIPADVASERLKEWLYTPNPSGITPAVEGFQLRDALEAILHSETARLDHREQRRVCAALRKLGFESRRSRRKDGVFANVWRTRDNIF